MFKDIYVYLDAPYFVFSSSLAAFMLLWHKTIIHCVARTTAACKHGLGFQLQIPPYNIIYT